VTGRVLVAERPTRLAITFGAPAGTASEPPTATFLIESHQQIVRLTLTHDHLPDEQALRDVSHGWPAVLSNLKSLLETGDPLPQVPWEMPIG
jgi:uncharacterized protein YndB with AHSA1/START domain